MDPGIEFTRVVEYKKMTKQISNSTTISKEYLLAEGESFYPIPSENNHKLYRKYESLIKPLKNVAFCGRLAEYKYFNMDQVIAKTLKLLRTKI